MWPVLGITYDFRFNCFIDYKVNHCFWYSKIAGRDALVESKDAWRLIDFPNALLNSHLRFWIVIELEASFHKPYWICGSWCSKASTWSTQNVDNRRVDWQISGGWKIEINICIILHNICIHKQGLKIKEDGLNKKSSVWIVLGRKSFESLRGALLAYVWY